MLGEFVVAVIGIMDVHPAGASLDSSWIKGSYFSASIVLTVANFGSRNLIKDWLLDYKSFKFPHHPPSVWGRRMSFLDPGVQPCVSIC